MIQASIGISSNPDIATCVATYPWAASLASWTRVVVCTAASAGCYVRWWQLSEIHGKWEESMGDIGNIEKSHGFWRFQWDFLIWGEFQNISDQNSADLVWELGNPCPLAWLFDPLFILMILQYPWFSRLLPCRLRTRGYGFLTIDHPIWYCNWSLTTLMTSYCNQVSS